MATEFDLEDYVGTCIEEISELEETGPRLNPLRWPLRYKLGVVGLFGAYLVPFVVSPLDLRPIINILFVIMFVMSWDVISGYTGQMSFGHAFFFGLGGYTTAILNIQHGMHPLFTIPIGMLVAIFGGVLIGLPALRLRGPYLSLVTLIAPLMLLQLFRVWSQGLVVKTPIVAIPIAPQGFGGTIGIPGSPQNLISTRINSIATVSSYKVQMFGNYYLALGLLTIILAVLMLITRSNIGDILTAIREEEDAVAASGINAAKFKLFAFMLSAAIGGLVSAIYVHSVVGFAQPGNILNFQLSIEVVILAILGGMGTIVGAIVGTLFFVMLELAASAMNFGIPLIEKDLNTLAPIILYTIALGVLIHRPRGLAPSLVSSGRSLLGWLTGEAAEGSQSSRPPLHTVIENYREDLNDLIQGRDKD